DHYWAPFLVRHRAERKRRVRRPGVAGSRQWARTERDQLGHQRHSSRRGPGEGAEYRTSSCRVTTAAGVMTRGRSTGALTSGGTRVQHLTHSSDQHPGAERLLEIDYPLPKGPALVVGLLGVPGHEEPTARWTIPLELLGKA